MLIDIFLCALWTFEINRNYDLYKTSTVLGTWHYCTDCSTVNIDVFQVIKE